MLDTDRLLTIPQAAGITCISPRTLWKLLAADRAPEIVRIGRSVRLRASDVDLWIELGCPSRADLELAKTRRTGGKQ